MKRTIDFLNISSFMVSVERVKDPGLKDKAVIVAPLNSDSAKVWDASFEAKEAGARKGMELALARRLDKGLKVVSPNPDLYQSIHKKLLRHASRLTPLFESEGLGKIYLDFTGFDKLYGKPENFARKAREQIAHSFSLAGRMGVSRNKLVAKAATNPYRVREEVLWLPKAGSFLDPFPNHALPVVKELKKSSALADVFEDLNLLTVGDLKGLDLTTLEALFPGRHEQVYQMARGVDHRPVLPPKNGPSIVAETHLEETNSLGRLAQTMAALADQAFAKLRAKSFVAGKVKLALRYADYKYLEKTIEFRDPKQFAHEAQSDLERGLGFLFSRRTAVRYLFLELLDLGKREVQLGLFEDPQKPLIKAVDDINKKFPRKLKFGREML